MTTETILTVEKVEEFASKQLFSLVAARKQVREIEQAVLQSPEIQALRRDAERMRRNTLLAVLGKLNSNPYNLTKSECIDVVREMFEEADAAMENQK